MGLTIASLQSVLKIQVGFCVLTTLTNTVLVCPPGHEPIEQHGGYSPQLTLCFSWYNPDSELSCLGVLSSQG